MVVKGGMNDGPDPADGAPFQAAAPTILRFIEYMDVGASNGWNMDEVVPSREVVRRISAEMPLVPVDANYTGETAARWRYADGSGEVGMISSVTQAFCTTARASACPPRASSTPACSPPAATTCAPCCATAAATRSSSSAIAHCGAPAPTAIPRPAPSTRRASIPPRGAQDRNVLHRRINKL
jgi:hypothetical protein